MAELSTGFGRGCARPHVATMTGILRGEGKTDAKDARVIADTAHMRTDLMGDWVRGVNQLRARLASIFPALEAVFDYSARSPLILVAGLCTPDEIRGAGIDGVTTYLAENGAWRKGIDAMAALSSIKAEGLSRTFYQRKRTERLMHTQALLALARRLVDALWALL